MQKIADYIDEICQVFELGKSWSDQEPVRGGRLHYVWKIKTEKGKFALKLLNERVMQEEQNCSAYERSELVARSFASRGIPAVPALLQKNGKCLHLIKKKAFMVYAWMEGKAHPVGTIDTQRAAIMGEVLGNIHAINLEHGDFQPAVKPIDPEQWKVFLKQSRTAGHPMAEQLDLNSKNLELWSENARGAAAALQENLILSHGDLDQQNVIWSHDSAPSIIDWESSGLQNASFELLNLCLDWSGFPESIPSKAAFLACYQGYQKTNEGKTRMTPLETTLIAEFAYLLRWLSVSLARSFETSGPEAEIACAESASALRSLCLLEEWKSMLLSWL